MNYAAISEHFVLYLVVQVQALIVTMFYIISDVNFEKNYLNKHPELNTLQLSLRESTTLTQSLNFQSLRLSENSSIVD